MENGMKKKKMKEGRRDFLKGSLVLGATGLISSLPGTDIYAAGQKKASQSPGRVDCQKKYAFETPPEPIPDSQIKSRISADVVVLGAGISGLCAAYSAASNGAKVIVVEKRKKYTSHGVWNGTLGNQLHKAQNINIPKDEVMADLMRFGAYHPNAELIRLWINESGRIMDRILDIADASGVKYMLDTDTKYHWPYKEYPLSILFQPAGNMTLVKMLAGNVVKKGVEIRYQSPALQLTTDRKHKVTGVITRDKNGYTRISAKKGVIICTGGYGNNKEMLEKYAPRALDIVRNGYPEGSNTGDGIMMGMWIGAAKQKTSCPMLWDGYTKKHGLLVNIARQPFLNVNLLGERYANEDAPFGYTANQDLQQPESMKWTVWDRNWKADAKKMHGTVCESMEHVPMLWNSKSYDRWKRKGVIIEADTLHDLARKMKIPRDKFLATVNRYNQLVKNGVDDDFGKDPQKLTAIAKPPFGAAKTGCGLMVTLDGLRINTELHVLNNDGKPISGLYAAGNASGDFFANDYAISCVGSSHGRAITFGWLAGEKVSRG